MMLLLSGEGPSDMGSCVSAAVVCEQEDFQPGPMAHVVDRLVAPVWGYSPMDARGCLLVSEASLGAYCRRERLGTTLPGRKKPAETGYYFKGARGLARLSQERSRRDGCPVGAVFFRDSDGTNSSRRSEWSEKVKSMEAGFAAEGFDRGVPMVPKPKSEAWLLCALQAVAYQNCARFEKLPGNDASPNSAKRELEKALAAMGQVGADLCDLIQKGSINPRLIEMPSFASFRTRLEIVARNMLR